MYGKRYMRHLRVRQFWTNFHYIITPFTSPQNTQRKGRNNSRCTYTNAHTTNKKSYKTNEWINQQKKTSSHTVQRNENRIYWINNRSEVKMTSGYCVQTPYCSIWRKRCSDNCQRLTSHDMQKKSPVSSVCMTVHICMCVWRFFHMHFCGEFFKKIFFITLGRTHIAYYIIFLPIFILYKWKATFLSWWSCIRKHLHLSSLPPWLRHKRAFMFAHFSLCFAACSLFFSSLVWKKVRLSKGQSATTKHNDVHTKVYKELAFRMLKSSADFDENFSLFAWAFF